MYPSVDAVTMATFPANLDMVMEEVEIFDLVKLLSKDDQRGGEMDILLQSIFYRNKKLMDNLRVKGYQSSLSNCRFSILNEEN